jgi:hypothetical protein
MRNAPLFVFQAGVSHRKHSLSFTAPLEGAVGAKAAFARAAPGGGSPLPRRITGIAPSVRRAKSRVGQLPLKWGGEGGAIPTF